MQKGKRLIEANALLDKVQFRMAIDNKNAEIIAGCVDITRRLIENAPTVDAIVSPVKIGQVLWCILPHSEFPLRCRVYCISREERNGLVLDYFRCTVKGWFGKEFSFEDVGKTVFLTEAEALAKMGGDVNG